MCFVVSLPDMSKVIINVPGGVHRAIRVGAAKEDREQYKLIREAILNYLVAHGHLKPEDRAEWEGKEGAR
jgi:hypothetical protein